MKKPKTKWCFLGKTEEEGMDQCFLKAVIAKWLLMGTLSTLMSFSCKGASWNMKSDIPSERVDIVWIVVWCLGFSLSLLWLDYQGLCKEMENSRWIYSLCLSSLVLCMYSRLALKLGSFSLCFSCFEVTVVCPHTLQFIIQSLLW